VSNCPTDHNWYTSDLEDFVTPIMWTQTLHACYFRDMENQSKNQILLAFGQAIRKRRLEIGLSQEAFAEKSHLHRTYIGGIERGKRNVALLNMIQIAQALEITSEQLMAKISDNLPNGFPKL